MKKILVLLIVILLLFCGCNTESENSVPVPDLNFIGNISVTYNNFNMICRIENSVADKCVVSVIEPKIISGLEIVFKNGACTIEYGDVSYELNEMFSSNAEFVSLFVKSVGSILETMEYEKLDNGNIRYTGMSEKGKFFLVQDSVTGYPMSFRIPQAGLKIIFSDMKSISDNGG